MFPNVPIADVPVPAAPLPPPGIPPFREAASAPVVYKHPSGVFTTPLAQRLTLNPTITAKVNYYDLARTRAAPHDLRTALIWLCLCAHDNSVWWEPRPPEHEDGEDDPPLPYKLNFAAWMLYIERWQEETFAIPEEDEIVKLALVVWLQAHRLVTVPDDDDDSKKNAAEFHPTGANSTPTSSPEGTAAGGNSSSTACPSAPSTASSTPGSQPTESPASAPPSPTAETPK